MVISDNGASSEGGPTGSVNENHVLQLVPESLEQNLAAHRRPRRPEVLQPLPVGLDLGRQHPVPALEARDLPRRHQRPLHRPLAARASTARGEVRTQYAHAIDMVPTVLDALGVEPPAQLRGVTQSPHRGRQLRPHLRRRRRALQARHPVLRDDRPPLDLPRRLAGGLPLARPLVRRGWAGRSARRSPAETLTELDATGWELYHVAEDFAENHDLADAGARRG